MATCPEADLLLERAGGGAGHVHYHAGGGCVHVLQQWLWRRSWNKQNSRHFFAKLFWKMKWSGVALVCLVVGCIPERTLKQNTEYVCTRGVQKSSNFLLGPLVEPGDFP